jgi:CubicO group peptidase (beta-lactamase class C family)
MPFEGHSAVQSIAGPGTAIVARNRERVRKEILRLLQAGVSGNVFPGGSVCVCWRDGDQPVSVAAAAGHLMPRGAAVSTDTPYDLASLTKPFVATAALRLVDAGKLALDRRADSVVGDVRGGPTGAATLEQLLAHRAGLAPWGGFYLDIPHDPGTPAARRWLIGEAARRAEGPIGTPVYSDLGYIIGGEMVARVAGKMLDRVVVEQVTQPLGIDDQVFYAGSLPADRQAELARSAPPTERCEWRGKIVQGEVHDENCAALGGVAGHAGLFGTASATAVLGRTMLDVHHGRSSFLSAELLQRALAPREGGTLRLGWDGKASTDSSAGRRMSLDSFGHLGFTGTSIWCDPGRDLVVVLLTNRVHPSRANQKIKAFRPAFHDGVVAAWDA